MSYRHLLGHLFCIFVILFWGMTFVSCKVLLESFTPIEILFDRFLLATLVLIPFCLKALKFISLKVELYSALVGFCGVTLYFVFENNALIFSNASNVSLIVSTAPFFVALFHCVIEKKFNLSINFFVGFITAIAGIACLSIGSLSLQLNPLGDLLALGCAIVWGGYNFYVLKLEHEKIDTLTITVKSFIYALVETVPFMYLYGYELKFDRILEPINLVNFGFLAILASSVCFYIWNKAINLIGAIRTNVYLYATPVVTVIGAVICIDEKVTIYTILGMTLAIGGLVISQTKTQQD